MGVKNLPIGV